MGGQSRGSGRRRRPGLGTETHHLVAASPRLVVIACPARGPASERVVPLGTRPPRPPSTTSSPQQLFRLCFCGRSPGPAASLPVAAAEAAGKPPASAWLWGAKLPGRRARADMLGMVAHARWVLRRPSASRGGFAGWDEMEKSGKSGSSLGCQPVGSGWWLKERRKKKKKITVLDWSFQSDGLRADRVTLSRRKETHSRNCRGQVIVFPHN